MIFDILYVVHLKYAIHDSTFHFKQLIKSTEEINHWKINIVETDGTLLFTKL